MVYIGTFAAPCVAGIGDQAPDAAAAALVPTVVCEPPWQQPSRLLSTVSTTVNWPDSILAISGGDEGPSRCLPLERRSARPGISGRRTHRAVKFRSQSGT